MKDTKHVTDLMLDLYHLGGASKKEIKIIEDTLAKDPEVKRRYEEIKKFDAQTRARYNLNEPPVFSVIKNDNHIKNKKVFIGIAAAAVLVCIFALSLNYFSGRTLNNNITYEMIKETDLYYTEEEDIFIADDKNYKTEHENIVNVPGEKKDAEVKNEAVSIAALPDPQPEVYTRGGALEQVTNTVPEQKNTDNTGLNIPPGITFIFEGMFANKQLTEIIIPQRITSIGKNAFANNPVVRVTIGANVSIEDSAIPGNFAGMYNDSGKIAGTYIRSNTNSSIWSKQ